MLEPLKQSIIGRAIENSKIEINIVDFREFSTNKHKKVDDYTYGGGNGMLLTPQPIIDAIISLKTINSHVVYLSPCGKIFNQEKAKELSKIEHLILICGHYEGIDQRIIDNYVDEEISIGDYILTCGEIPAMVLVDSIVRLLPSVLHNDKSKTTESFENNLLEYPQYTRPQNFRGMIVPEVLINGNHQEVDKWRENQALIKTKKNRPDLLNK